MIRKLKDYFISLDQDNSATISSNELEDPLLLFGLCKNKQDVEEVFKCKYTLIKSSTSMGLENWSSNSFCRSFAELEWRRGNQGYAENTELLNVKNTENSQVALQ
jgi:hypothetical protein